MWRLELGRADVWLKSFTEMIMFRFYVGDPSSVLYHPKSNCKILEKWQRPRKLACSPVARATSKTAIETSARNENPLTTQNARFKIQMSLESSSVSLALRASSLNTSSYPHDDSESITPELVTISTIGSQARAAEWMKEHKVPNATAIKVYNSRKEMLRMGHFDVVYISNVKIALPYERNILLKKPATMNRAQYAKLVDYAKEQGVVLMEAMWTQYFPSVQSL